MQVRDGPDVVQSAAGRAGAEMVIPIPHPKPWSPDHPFLYDLTVTLRHGDGSTDDVRSYFGLRKVSLGDDHGVKKILINNQFVFQFGPLDQGW